MTPTCDLTGLIKTHHLGVWRYLRVLGCDEVLADDLVQETFLGVIEKPFDDYNRQATAAYLRNAARFAFLNSLRRSERRRAEELADAADEMWAELAPDDSGNSYLSALRECLEGLKGRERQALEMRYQDGASGAEIAAALEMNEGALKTMTHRAREQLRRCIESKV